MTIPWGRIRKLTTAIATAVPIVVLLGFVVRGCSTAHVPIAHPPPGVTLPPTTVATASDLTGVSLPGVDGTTTLVVPRATGTAHLSGSVVGPQGPVPGAVVRVEHLVDGRPPPTDVASDAAGHWDLPNIAGGRYRVRAFLAPTLSQTQPQVFFLSDGEQRNVDLTLDSFSDIVLSVAIAPDPPQLGQQANLVVRVARHTVDASGVVQTAPVANAAVAVTGAQGWSVVGSASAATNASGDATFGLQCTTAGAHQVQLAVRPLPTDQPQPSTQEVSACVDPRATSTTPTTGTGSGGPTSTSSSSSSKPN
ncbi:MAG TPA: carboxypeptidase-like regulatory domain-containing protein [Acidimicrobiales bacterium]|jgi:hypothetical protein|nr:carboxypeptidase-like regulatory domain-containing protein [Acidimicrobiales bacterium]